MRDEEPYFFGATLLKESAILEIDEETFQPAWSPDGKEVAYLQERVELKVINLESGKTRTILPGDRNYSYSDGDQWFEWSPDGQWIAYTRREKTGKSIRIIRPDGSVTDLSTGFETPDVLISALNAASGA